MRFMMMVKGNKQSEAGVMPTEQELADMARYNEELVKAGVLLAAEGLKATSSATKVSYNGSKRTITDGPFSEAKEVLAGYWIIQVKSKEEALEWAKRVPFNEGEVELRPFFELEDFNPGAAIDHHTRNQAALEKQQR